MTAHQERRERFITFGAIALLPLLFGIGLYFSESPTAHAESQSARMRVVSEEEVIPHYVIRVWVDTQNPGVTCYGVGIDIGGCVYIPTQEK